MHPLCFAGQEPINAPLSHSGPAKAVLAELGITHTLDEVFDAPMLVKKILAANSGINHAFAGTRKTDSPAMLEKYFSLTSNTLWTPSNQYSVSGSRYNPGVKNTRLVQTRPCRLLGGVDSSAQRTALQNDKAVDERRKAELDGELRVIRKQELEVEKELAELNKRRVLAMDAKVNFDKDMKSLQKQARHHNIAPTQPSSHVAAAFCVPD